MVHVGRDRKNKVGRDRNNKVGRENCIDQTVEKRQGTKYHKNTKNTMIKTCERQGSTDQKRQGSTDNDENVQKRQLSTNQERDGKTGTESKD